MKIIGGPSTPGAPCAGAHVCLGRVDHTGRDALIPDGIHGARQLGAHWPGAAVDVRRVIRVRQVRSCVRRRTRVVCSAVLTYTDTFTAHQLNSTTLNSADLNYRLV